MKISKSDLLLKKVNNKKNRLGLVVLMGDRFGNYVIQRLFECNNEELRHKIYETIVQPENLEEIKKTNFGIKI